MLGAFTVKKKKSKTQKVNLHLTQNRLERNDNHSYMCHICAKGFLDSNLN